MVLCCTAAWVVTFSYLLRAKHIWGNLGFIGFLGFNPKLSKNTHMRFTLDRQQAFVSSKYARRDAAGDAASVFYVSNWLGA